MELRLCHRRHSESHCFVSQIHHDNCNGCPRHLRQAVSGAARRARMSPRNAFVIEKHRFWAKSRNNENGEQNGADSSVVRQK
jgi:hypothetical protein